MEGDLVVVYERYDSMKPVKVTENGVLQNRFGVFKHSDWIGKAFGSKVFSSKGGFVYLLAPTPELWTLVLSHRTQILYIADISFVVMYLEIVPGCGARVRDWEWILDYFSCTCNCSKRACLYI
ncbi:UNVERIFIED_CONTAM: tRNA (adenine(58)-N(1))-methyltransferase catalytic subunit TRMT61A [Sesamum radiatum]|uniref:tRNA (adenine(58)-N(1))-methyltransferase n=1 Tax=Sesamum radiatum TaxID=300843 RepID=A0AAW2P763_SESRA